jgi:hypothetical protein
MNGHSSVAAANARGKTHNLTSGEARRATNEHTAYMMTNNSNNSLYSTYDVSAGIGQTDSIHSSHRVGTESKHGTVAPPRDHENDLVTGSHGHVVSRDMTHVGLQQQQNAKSARPPRASWVRVCVRVCVCVCVCVACMCMYVCVCVCVCGRDH